LGSINDPGYGVKVPERIKMEKLMLAYTPKIDYLLETGHTLIMIGIATHQITPDRSHHRKHINRGKSAHEQISEFRSRMEERCDYAAPDVKILAYPPKVL